MRHDKAPFIAVIDRMGSRVLVRAGKDFDGINVTVKVNDGKQRKSGELQDGEVHLQLPGTLPEFYSMEVTYPKQRPKPVAAPQPQEPKQAETVAETRVTEKAE